MCLKNKLRGVSGGLFSCPKDFFFLREMKFFLNLFLILKISLGHERRAYSTIDIQVLVPMKVLYVIKKKKIPTYTLSQRNPSMWKNESKRGNNDFNPLSAYVLTNSFIWRGNISVVQITMSIESILRSLWAFHRLQKAYNVYFSTHVCGSQNRQSRCECQCTN
jgi:hypothetical protein